MLEEIDAEGDCFGCGDLDEEDNVIIVEELSGLDKAGHMTVDELLTRSADVNLETVLLGTFGGATA